MKSSLQRPRSEELCEWIEKESPELDAEDAFVVPHWFSEQRSWFKDPANSNSAVCNSVLLVRLRGSLNAEALLWSLQEVVRRHEVFRSVFRMKDGELIQIVVATKKVDLQVEDLRGCLEAEREVRAQQHALAEAQQPFDLAQGPLLRSTVLRLGADEQWLQLTTHDIVFDDWSSGILFREVADLYQASSTGTASHLPDLAFQYSDYVRWQEERLRGTPWKAKLAYWKQQLSSRAGFHHLPTDFARPEQPSYRTARAQMTLPIDLAESLKALARQERVSLFMVLLAGFQCLLHRYSTDEEIGVASCAANRPLVEVEGLIGRFGNEIFLRTSFAGNPTFRELFGRVRETALNAYSDQDLPFGKLLQASADGADPNRRTPFQVMFFPENTHEVTKEAAGLVLSRLPFRTGAAKYDFNVCLTTEPTLQVAIEYGTDLFRPATAERILVDYQAILETMTQSPEARVGTFSISQKAMPLRLESVNAVTSPGDNSDSEEDFSPRLLELWEAAFGMRPIGLEQDFFELGGDSLMAARLFNQIAKSFHIDLPLATLLDAPTVKRLAGAINAAKINSFGSSLVTIHSAGAKAPLFCVHGHAGEVFYGRNLSRALGPDQPLYGLRSQGLGGEQPCDTVEDMAAHYLREIQTIQPHGPYYLSGFCFGGMIAYEMARLLKARGEEVPLLALFNAPSPGALKGWPLTKIYLIRRIAHELRKLRALGTREKVALVRDKAAGLISLTLGNFKGALWRALTQSSSRREIGKRAGRFLSVPNLNVLAAKAYDPAPYPGRILLFLTNEIGSMYPIHPERGWGELADEGIEIYAVAGDNLSLFDSDLVAPLAKQLQACLAGALSGLPRDKTKLNPSAFHGRGPKIVRVG